MITAWILMYGLSTGAVAVHSVYTAESACEAQRSVLRLLVQGETVCLAVEIKD